MSQEYLVVPVGKEGLRKQDDKEPVGKGHRSQPGRASHGQSKNSLSNGMGRAGREGKGQADSMLSRAHCGARSHKPKIITWTKIKKEAQLTESPRCSREVAKLKAGKL